MKVARIMTTPKKTISIVAKLTKAALVTPNLGSEQTTIGTHNVMRI